MFEDDEDEIPRKWMDKKSYVRMDPKTAKPQLVRVEPFIVPETQEFVPFQVYVYVDDNPPMVMGREEAENYIAMTGCEPLEIAAKWKNLTKH